MFSSLFFLLFSFLALLSLSRFVCVKIDATTTQVLGPRHLFVFLLRCTEVNGRQTAKAKKEKSGEPILSAIQS
jgi:hypothetical protein